MEEALRFEAKNGDSLWQDTIDKEMNNSGTAFQILEEGAHTPVGYMEITCHLIFNVEMNLAKKARYLVGDHLTPPPSPMIYAGILGRETVRIAFLIADLNNLQVLAGDIQNANVNSYTKKNYFMQVMMKS